MSYSVESIKLFSQSGFNSLHHVKSVGLETKTVYLFEGNKTDKRCANRIRVKLHLILFVVLSRFFCYAFT